MQVTVEQLGPVKKKINVVIPPDRVAEEVAMTYQQLRQQVRIRGFRQGKVPEDLLRKYYKEQVEGEVVSRLIQNSYPEALKTVQAVPISQPVLENGILEEGKEFSYSASFEVKPKISLQDYLGLEVEKEKLKVSAEDVEKRLSMIRESHASFREVEEDRPIRAGDFIVADIDGTLQSKPFEGGTLRDYLFEVGVDQYLPGLSEKLLGLAKGAATEIVLNLPADFRRRELAGQEVRLQVAVKGLKSKVLPDLDDAFARDLGEYQGLEDLKVQLRESMEKEGRDRIDGEVKRKLIDELIKKNPIDVPPLMVDRKIEFMMADTQRTLQAQGSSLEKLGISPEGMMSGLRPEAERQVKSSLLVEEIARCENLAVGDDEVETQLNEIARSTDKTGEQLKDFYRREGLWEGLRFRLLENKTIDFLLGRATIRELDKPAQQ
jgi:trigger factor